EVSWKSYFIGGSKMNLKEVDINIEEWEMVEIPFYTEEELTYRLKNDLPITKSEFEEQESKNEFL
ncbi:hypothetical protein, partial [Staphylococcus aureus]